MHLKLLFSVNCQTTIAFRAIVSLHLHHLWVCHKVHHIVSPLMWVRATVRNVGPPYLGFPFPVGLSSFYRSLQGYSYLTLPSLVGPPHSELHCFPSYVDPPHCEKCGSATFRISLSGGSATLLTL